MCKRISEIFDESQMCDWCGRFILIPEYCDHTFETKWNCKKCGFIYKAKLENDVILDLCFACLDKNFKEGKVAIKREGKWKWNL